MKKFKDRLMFKKIFEKIFFKVLTAIKLRIF